MSTAQAPNAFSLEMERSLDAPVERVFQAWTQAEGLEQWFSPADELKVVVHELDVRVGGRYRIQMDNPDGDPYIVAGEYVAIEAPTRLVFTWFWATDPDEVMLVTIDLVAEGDTTRLRLLQEKMPSQLSVDLHDEGWAGCYDRLERYLAA